MTDQDHKERQGVVYFWDSLLYSPGVVLPEIGDGLRKRLANFIDWLKEDESWTTDDSPANLAANFLIFSAGESSQRVTLKNTPAGLSTGATMMALQQQQVGGAGSLLINLVTEECQQWGGYGIYPKEGFNARQVRTFPLSEIVNPPELVAIPPRKGSKKGKTDARATA